MQVPQEPMCVSMISAPKDAMSHPITKPMLHNATRSPLARLPDDILLKIMKHADDVSLLCLRRTCRTMLRLFSTESQFRRYRQDRFLLHSPRLYSFIWSLERVPEPAKGPLRALLRRDMYCELCRGVEMREKRKKLEEERLYCSGCKRKHSAGLFSYHQRRRSSNNTRVCIGREGYISVCEHTTISWDDVEDLLDDSAEGFICKHPSHRSAFGQGRCGDRNGAVVVKLREPLSIPHPPCCDDESLTDNLRTWLCLKWSTQITFPDLGFRQALDHDEVLNKIEWARGVAGSYIFPYPKRRFPVELQFFDPNACSCIRLPRPPHGVPAWRWAAENRWSSPECRLHGLSRRRKILERWFSNDMIDLAPTPKGPKSCIDPDTSLSCLTLKMCDGIFTRTPNCVEFVYRKFIPMESTDGRLTQPWSESWFMELDPESFSILEDSESHGVYWCKTESCLNYHRNYRFNRKRRTLDPDYRGRMTKAGGLNGVLGVLLKMASLGIVLFVFSFFFYS
ncbi:hypothetical protein V8F20_007967 [Naviculisporaceae sp. PSN 640]